MSTIERNTLKDLKIMAQECFSLIFLDYDVTRINLDDQERERRRFESFSSWVFEFSIENP